MNLKPFRTVIQEILEAADDSLSSKQIHGRMVDGGRAPASPSTTASFLRQGEVDGQFVRSDIHGVLHWTTNPEWVPGKARKAKAVLAEVDAIKPALRGALDTTRIETVVALVPSARPAPESDHAALAPAPAPAAAPPVRKVPANLDMRLDAIAEDLRDAVKDACAHKLPHDLLAWLMDANHAALVAARELAKGLKP